MTIPLPSLWLWGLLPGPREVFVVAMLVLVLFGKSRVARRGLPRLIRPWTSRTPGHAGLDWLADRWFAVAVVAVATWVVTWMIVANGPPGR